MRKTRKFQVWLSRKETQKLRKKCIEFFIKYADKYPSQEFVAVQAYLGFSFHVIFYTDPLYMLLTEKAWFDRIANADIFFITTTSEVSAISLICSSWNKQFHSQNVIFQCNL